MSDQAMTRAMTRPLPVGAIDTHAVGFWAMIFMIITEASLFGYLLFSYYYYASQARTIGYFPPDGVPPSIHLSGPDTAVLLLSSVAVSWAQFNIKHNNNRRLLFGLGSGAALGIVFLIVQYFEWAEKPFTMASNVYGSLFFTITGFHMAHVFVGVIVLLWLFVWSWKGYFNKERYAHIHIGALYWHFVDVVWLFIFFTFYLTPRIAQ